ncbi:unnamed protein product [Tilletia controversa]|uniref:Gamma-glutamyltransferase n=3 Tax=Tilletia TaxID=13289 RepID=A0A8X7MT22_9BASI|nr:hypothetical protein CF336_g8628 [Tilletia laevis]KAE8196876.1 hypothetical protein CF328_g4009 [Tilletia controversa]KAE8251204.1 hypothetical protein A4X03_0g6397 [Tilletia caries]KAE8183832.1 hypothetical protein CF335_g8205 [Tilletia laevis]KAE8247060.1 hypothetical protein A4X06_0g4729 [Tilletia controversa]
MTSSARKPLDWAACNPGAQLHFSRFASRRSTVFSSKGIVSCSQPLAAAAGIEILNAGGNAADAAVAVAAALNVTEPSQTGIGGDAFALFYNASDKTVRGINGSGRSPAKATLESVKAAGFTRELPPSSAHSITVPGAAAAWVDTVELFGSGKLSLSDILTPAIRLADNGYPVHEISAYLWDRSEQLLKQQQHGHEMLIGSSSAEARAPRAGELMRMPNLARTFRDLSTLGKEAFYKGRIAREIVAVVQENGGHMELDDLEDHIQRGVDEVKPVHYTYHSDAAEDAADGVTLYECPPNGQGLVALLALGILDAAQRLNIVPDLRTLEHNSPEYLHALIEALRLAFADARKFVSDPQHLKDGKPSVDLDHVLSPSYLESRAKLIDPKRASADPEAGSPFATSDTVYFTVADKDGNACSFINSNYSGFGSCVVPKGCGFTLQNRGSCFSLEEGHSNVYAPRKRPLHTILPAMATRGKDLFLSFGVMGGEMQPQGHVQVLLNVLHRGFTPQSSLDAPRFCIGAGMLEEDSATGAKNSSTVFLEEGIDPAVGEALKAMGHRIEFQTGFGRAMFGRGQVIQRLSTTVKKVDAEGNVVVDDEGQQAGRVIWAAGSDPRADGQAVAQI